MRLLKLLLLLCVCAAGPVSAGPYEDVRAALEKHDYATALRLVRPLADEGHAYAQAILGSMYDEGKGVPQDAAAAMSWYRKAADRGLAIAQFLLGTMHAEGQGVPQDYVLAHMWFNLAAARSFSDAATSRDTVAAKMTPARVSPILLFDYAHDLASVQSE